MASKAGTQHEIEAVVFDMDGVLIDSRPVIEKAWRDATQRHGRVLAPSDVDRYVHGRAGAETVSLLFPDHTDAQRKAIWAEVDTIEEEAIYPLIPGVDIVANRLAECEVPIALATSSWPRKIENALGQLGLLHLFATQVTREDVARGKPHPDPYLAAIRRIGSDPGRTLVFEDSVSGVSSAVAAGAVCVGIGDDELRSVGAVVTVRDFRAFSIDDTAGTARLIGPNISIRFVPREACSRV